MLGRLRLCWQGGQADESALVRLLTSLDGGQGWDLARVQNQARWAASQAVLILREHRAAYDALTAEIAAGASVGSAVVALEAALSDSFGRNGELPADTRRRKRAAQAGAAASDASASAAAARDADDTASAAAAAERSGAIDSRLGSIAARLAAIDATEAGPRDD